MKSSRVFPNVVSGLIVSAGILAAGAFTGVSAQSVRINEFMANNDTIASPATVKADWIELYNTTSSPVSLAGQYLSDDAALPSKWQFPTGTTIAANGYLVVWAYDTTFAGSLYAGWSLNKDGEHVRLSASNLSVLDSVTFGVQLKNRSAARIPNGTGSFSSACLPTLGMANTCVVTSLTAGHGLRAADGLTLARGGAGRLTLGFNLQASARTYLAVHDSRGREVALLMNGPMSAGSHVRTFDAAGLPSGTYWVVLRSGTTESVRSLVLLR